MATKIVTDTGLRKALELVSDEFKSIKEPLPLQLENEDNHFAVGVDNTGTKHDIIETSETFVDFNGKTLVNNLIPYNDTFALPWAMGTGTAQRVFKLKPDTIKANTTYSLIFNISGLTFGDGTYTTADFCFSIGGVTTIYMDNITSNGLRFATFNQAEIDYFQNNANYNFRMQNARCQTGVNYTVDWMLILEGDYTNKITPEYFTGLKSATETNDNLLTIRSTGKNLFDENLLTGGIYNLQGNMNDIGHLVYRSTKLFLLKGTYVLSSTKDLHIVRLFSDSKRTTFMSANAQTITTYRKWKIILDKDEYLYFTARDATSDQTQWDGSISIQLEQSDVATPYETYHEEITTIQLTEPLRSLPNGMKDTVTVTDDKVIVERNIYQFTLNGTENWGINNGSLDETRINKHYHSKCIDNLNLNYVGNATASHVHNQNGLSDLFKVGYPYGVDEVSWSIVGTPTSISRLRIGHTSTNVETFKTWLSENTPTFTAQLLEPTFEWYELPSIKLHKDGHVFVETGAIPLSTNVHEVSTSLRSAMDNSIEEINQIKEELLTLDMEIATQDDVSDMWPTLLEGGSE